MTGRDFGRKGTKVWSKVATKVMRIARGTALTISVAVMLALVLGVSTTALAGTGVGAPFESRLFQD